MTQLFVWLQTRLDLRNEEGQTAVEYAMVVGLVAIALALALAAGGVDVFGTFWDKVTSTLNFAT
jgi:Flp pilus assembly pilin Flp